MSIYRVSHTRCISRTNRRQVFLASSCPSLPSFVTFSSRSTPFNYAFRFSNLIPDLHPVRPL